jgi:hypothetical protein
VLKIAATLRLRRRIEKNMKRAKQTRTKKGLIAKLLESKRGDSGKKGEERTEEQSRE